jgi:ribosome-binding protein aMBF1 (putative translation factor)
MTRSQPDDSKRRDAVRAPAGDRRSDVEVIEITDQEYDQAVRSALRELGLTYAQLREQARRGDFKSGRARRLWLTIGTADCA